MLNYSVILEDAARTLPDKTAFIFGDRRWSFRELDQAAARIATGLKALGVEPGDRVAVSCPNVPYIPMIMFGVLKAGAVYVPLNILLKTEEIAYHLRDCQAKAFLCFEGTEALPMGAWGHAAFEMVPGCDMLIAITADPAAASPFEGCPTLGHVMAAAAPINEAAPTNPDDTAIIIYTSGTTGDPKGAELTHSNVMMNTFLLRDLMHYQPSDVSLLVLPLFHVFGLIVQMSSGILAGITHVIQPRFDPETVLQAMARENVSVFCGTPTMYWALLHHDSPTAPDPVSIGRHLRCCISSGQSMPGPTLKAFEEKFSTTIIEGYGMSEASPGITFNRLEMPRKIGSVGTPFWGINVRIVDTEDRDVAQGETGEIICRGHNVMKGYFNAPEKTAHALRGGWLHTGDIGRFDENGYLYIVDRLKEMIIRGGENVYPTEVEKMLTEHPAISLVAVIGTPDEKYGQEIKACAVLKAGASLTEEEFIAWAKNRMAATKYPRKVEFMAQLPMTATGKILKKELVRRELARCLPEPA